MDKPNAVRIPLLNSDLFATVDADAAEFVAQFPWYVIYHDGAPYAATFIRGDEGGEQIVYMHDMIAARAGLFD